MNLCEHALEIEKAGERAASLTKQLLAFSRQQVLPPPAILDELLELSASHGKWSLGRVALT